MICSVIVDGDVEVCRDVGGRHGLRQFGDDGRANGMYERGEKLMERIQAGLQKLPDQGVSGPPAAPAAPAPVPVVPVPPAAGPPLPTSGVPGVPLPVVPAAVAPAQP